MWEKKRVKRIRGWKEDEIKWQKLSEVLNGISLEQDEALAERFVKEDMKIYYTICP